MSKDQFTNTESESIFGKYHIIIKSVIIFILLLIFIIPQVIIHSLIDEREYLQVQAFEDIASKWSGRQTVTGPILVLPYKEYYRDTNKVLRFIKHNLYVLPDEANINGEVLPQKRHRNIYEVVVYNSNISIDAKFKSFNLNEI